MADLLLCLDSGCGIDLTNTAGRLGASIRTDTARALKCDATTRQLYVGVRGYSGQLNPTAQQDCVKQLNIDSNGDLWVAPELALGNVQNLANTGWLSIPGAADPDDLTCRLVYTNNTGCSVVVSWRYTVQLRLKLVPGFGSGNVATWIGNMTTRPTLAGDGGCPQSTGVGSTVTLRDSVSVPFSTTGFGPNEVFSRNYSISGFHVLGAGQSLYHTHIASTSKLENFQNIGGSADSGLSFVSGAFSVHRGVEI